MKIANQWLLNHAIFYAIKLLDTKCQAGSVSAQEGVRTALKFPVGS